MHKQDLTPEQIKLKERIDFMNTWTAIARQLMKENPEMSYTEAKRTAMARALQ